LVETPEVLDENANTLDKVSFWVDTGRSFAVVRKAYRSKPKNGDEWTETLVAEGNGYWRHETGLWLPSSYTEQSYKFTSKDQKVRDLYARHHLTLSNWRLNLTLAPTYFDMSFPPGVLVTNEVSGKTYKTGRLNDEDLTKQFEEAQAAADAAAQSARNFRWFRAGISFSLGLLTVICAVLVLRCWRRMAVA
jgi:hypothetical protein